jgi:hypothetical protein
MSAALTTIGALEALGHQFDRHPVIASLASRDAFDAGEFGSGANMTIASIHSGWRG